MYDKMSAMMFSFTWWSAQDSCDFLLNYGFRYYDSCISELVKATKNESICDRELPKGMCDKDTTRV